MRTFIITITTLISGLVFGQSNFDQEMNQAFYAWQNGNQSATVAFKEVMKNNNENWLPKYYVAFTQTLQSFENSDFKTRQDLIDDARVLINQLENSYPNNPEILNLKALNLTSEIALNPMANGMALMDEINSIYSKSIVLNPTNPRSILGKAEFNINASKFIGGDITNDCKAVKNALALFGTEKPAKFEPNWGKDRAENLLKTECKNQ